MLTSNANRLHRNKKRNCLKHEYNNIGQCIDCGYVKKKLAARLRREWEAKEREAGLLAGFIKPKEEKETEAPE